MKFEAASSLTVLTLLLTFDGGKPELSEDHELSLPSLVATFSSHHMCDHVSVYTADAAAVRAFVPAAKQGKYVSVATLDRGG